MRSATLALHVGHAMTRQLKVGTTLGASWDFHAHSSIYRFYIYFGTKRSVNKADCFTRKDEVTFASKLFVSLNVNDHIQVAFSAISRCLATLVEANGRAVIDTSWDFEFNLLVLTFGALATTD